jgi:hypothetical protein
MLDFRDGSKAEVGAFNIDVRFSPESGHQRTKLERPLIADRRRLSGINWRLFDDLVGTSKQRLGNIKAQRFSGFEVDRQVVFCWGLHR